MVKQSSKQTAVARQLRKADTWAEQLLWRWLRGRRFSAYKFRRQQPTGAHILDFFCNEAKLNIELDGSQHGHPEHQQADAERDACAATRGAGPSAGRMFSPRAWRTTPTWAFRLTR